MGGAVPRTTEAMALGRHGRRSIAMGRVRFLKTSEKIRDKNCTDRETEKLAAIGSSEIAQNRWRKKQSWGAGPAQSRCSRGRRRRRDRDKIPKYMNFTYNGPICCGPRIIKMGLSILSTQARAVGPRPIYDMSRDRDVSGKNFEEQMERFQPTVRRTTYNTVEKLETEPEITIFQVMGLRLRTAINFSRPPKSKSMG